MSKCGGGDTLASQLSVARDKGPLEPALRICHHPPSVAQLEDFGAAGVDRTSFKVVKTGLGGVETDARHVRRMRIVRLFRIRRPDMDQCGPSRSTWSRSFKMPPFLETVLGQHVLLLAQ